MKVFVLSRVLEVPLSQKSALNKSEIVRTLPLQLSVQKSKALVDAVFSTIKNGIEEDNIVKVARFGTFMVRSKNSRLARNPKTLEEVMIEPRKVLVFRASKHLKNVLDNSVK